MSEKTFDKTCEYCGCQFKVHHYRKDIARFCGMKCKGKAQEFCIDDILLNIILHDPSTLDTGCWGYPKSPDGDGYIISVIKRKQKQLHKLMYEHFVGAIPKGMVCHHRCQNKWCCNFEHIELKTPSDHNREVGHIAQIHASKTHCPHGHPYNDSNTLIKNTGARRCRECARIESEKYRERVKDNPPPSWRPKGKLPKKTHCPQGHPYDEENTYVAQRGDRQCRICRRERDRLWRETHRSR